MKEFLPVAGLMILLTLSLSVAHAGKESPIHDGLMREGNNTLTGKLNRYGDDFVVVGGEKIAFCNKCQFLDLLGKEITVQGFVGTDAVRVTLRGNPRQEYVPLEESCAVQVQAIRIRR